MKLLQKTPKCALRLCFEAMKVLFACLSLISIMRLFLNISSIINKAQFSIFLRAFRQDRFFEQFIMSVCIDTLEQCTFKFVDKVSPRTPGKRGVTKKNLGLEVKRKQGNKTFMASRHTFNAHLGVICRNSNKIVFFFQSVWFNEKSMVWIVCAIYLKTNMQIFLNSCIFPFRYIVISVIGKTVPVRTKFIYHFHGYTNYLSKQIQPN